MKIGFSWPQELLEIFSLPKTEFWLSACPWYNPSSFRYRSDEPHIPVLVTNGELVGDAPTSIKAFSDKWEKLGSQPIQVWQRGRLLSMFINAHGTYLPARLTDFREFVELYVSDFQDRLPRKKLAEFLTRLVNPSIAKGRTKKTKRAIESMVLLGSYLIQQYERESNHLSAAEGWTVVAASIFHVAEREQLPISHYGPSLSLVREGLNNNLHRLRREAIEREHFVEPSFIVAETDFIRGVRTLITLGWLTATSLSRILQPEEEPDVELLKAVKKYLPTIALSGEADWPSLLCISLFLEGMTGSSSAEDLLEVWVQSIIEASKDKDAAGVPPPYWLQEKVLSLRYGQLPPYKSELFNEHSYTLLSALDLLVRRLCRRFVANVWAKASRLTFCEYRPDAPAEWFLWRSQRGELQLIVSKQPASWSKWRDEVASVQSDSVPTVLLKHPEWILPFALTYPHRLNRSLSAVIDALIGDRASIVMPSRS